MAKVDILNIEGRKVGDQNLPKEIFEVEVKPGVVQKAVRIFLSNKRAPIAHTKNRSERRGGGAKPWKQKGTGRARAGSRRSPIWRKGGVTFGPRNERNFSLKMNKKEKRKALFMALSDLAAEKSITLVDKIEMDKPQTKTAATALQKLNLNAKKTLIVLPEKNENVMRSFSNIPSATVTTVESLNIYEVVNAGQCMMPVDSVEALKKHFLKAS